MTDDQEVVIAIAIEVGEHRSRGAAQLGAPSGLRPELGVAQEQLIRMGAVRSPDLIGLRLPIPEGPHYQIGISVTVDLAKRRRVPIHPHQRLDETHFLGHVLE
jgi:hypothetical protein